MIAIIFLIISFLFGVSINKFVLPPSLERNFVKIPISFLLGTFIGTWSVFLLNIILPLQISFIVVLYVLFIITIFIFPYKNFNKAFVHISLLDVCVFFGSIGISIWLVNQSLHFTPTGTLEIASNYWGDFDLHLPLIRSFAWGKNMPPSLPFFPNANAAYHFMFDYWSALLSFGGLSLSYAFNIASILSLSSLLFVLYVFVTKLFANKKFIGILTIILFLFNSTLTFVEAYPKLHPENLFDYFYKITQNNMYLSAGPFTSDHVSIIWNLNVYLNQRHLIFAFALGLTLLLILFETYRNHLTKKMTVFFALIIGLLPLFSLHIFLCLVIFFFIFGLIHLKKNPYILLVVFFAILPAIPQLIFLSHDVHNMIQWNPGFLVPKPLTIDGILIYWLYNLGISLFTIPLGFYFSNREQKKWFLGFLGIFLIANLIQFNVEMFNNHKLFNFWILVSNAYSAFFVFLLYKKAPRWKWLILPIIIFLLTFSGIIDFFVIQNDHFYTVADYGKDNLVTWVATHTPQNAIFLTATDSMYNPIRLAGRKTFGISPRFVDTEGYDFEKRNIIIEKILASQDKTETLQLLKQNKINYVELPKHVEANLSINTSFFVSNFPVAFETNDYTFYAIP